MIPDLDEEIYYRISKDTLKFNANFWHFTLLMLSAADTFP